MYLKSLPVQLVLVIVFTLFFGSFLPLQAVNILYTGAHLFKELLMMFIPCVVFGYLMSSIVSYDKRSFFLVGLVILLIVLSSALTALSSFSIFTLLTKVLSLNAISGGVPTDTTGISSYLSLPFNSPLTPSRAILAALFLGFATVFGSSHLLKSWAFKVRDTSTYILQKFFIPLLPLYVMGISLKIQASGSLHLLISSYGKVLLLSYLIALTFVMVVLFLYAGRSIKRTKELLSVLSKPIFAGFTTMSGLAAMPFLVDAISRTTRSKQYGRFVVPLTVNTHTLGDGLSVLISTMTLLFIQKGYALSFSEFLPFAGYYCLARFFNACVPGGGILVMAPFIQSTYDISNESMGFLTTLYLLQDPLITSINILGNGTFALVIKPLLGKKLMKDTTSSSHRPATKKKPRKNLSKNMRITS